MKQCGFDVDDRRFMIVGCQTLGVKASYMTALRDVPGFDAVALGKKAFQNMD